LSGLKFAFDDGTGTVYEQRVILETDKKLEIRRIVVKLNEPTRNGESEIALFTNLPVQDANAIKIAEIYRLR